eukprot:6190172-Pleurochrysis_carterae.AAC.2
MRCASRSESLCRLVGCLKRCMGSKRRLLCAAACTPYSGRAFASDVAIVERGRQHALPCFRLRARARLCAVACVCLFEETCLRRPSRRVCAGRSSPPAARQLRGVHAGVRALLRGGRAARPLAGERWACFFPAFFALSLSRSLAFSVLLSLSPSRFSHPLHVPGSLLKSSLLGALSSSLLKAGSPCCLLCSHFVVARPANCLTARALIVPVPPFSDEPTHLLVPVFAKPRLAVK